MYSKTDKIDELVKRPHAVIPAQAGIHNILKSLDSRLRGNDKKGQNRLFTRPSCLVLKILNKATGGDDDEN